MSGEQAKAAWQRLCEILPASARADCFGLTPNHYYRLVRQIRQPGKRTLQRVIQKYDLDADHILHGKSPHSFVEKFPLAACRVAYHRDPKQRLPVFYHIALHHFLEIKRRYPDAFFAIPKTRQAVITIPLKNDDAIQVEIDAMREIILTFKMTLGQIPMSLRASQDLPSNMEKFCQLIAFHKRRSTVNRVSQFEKARKKAQEHMTSYATT